MPASSRQGDSRHDSASGRAMRAIPASSPGDRTTLASPRQTEPFASASTMRSPVVCEMAEATHCAGAMITAVMPMLKAATRA